MYNVMDHRYCVRYRLVQVHPDAKPLFSEVNIDDVYGPVFEAHALRVVTGIDLCINSLHDTRLLEEITAHLAMQHKQRHTIKAEFFMVGPMLFKAPQECVNKDGLFPQ